MERSVTIVQVRCTNAPFLLLKRLIPRLLIELNSSSKLQKKNTNAIYGHPIILCVYCILGINAHRIICNTAVFGSSLREHVKK